MSGRTVGQVGGKGTDGEEVRSQQHGTNCKNISFLVLDSVSMATTSNPRTLNIYQEVCRVPTEFTGSLPGKGAKWWLLPKPSSPPNGLNHFEVVAAMVPFPSSTHQSGEQERRRLQIGNHHPRESVR